MLKIPKGYDTTTKTFRLPIELVDKMDELAAKNKISLNKLVTECLIYAMMNIDDKDGDKTGNE
jgi:predicted HicB family RNase H-like nuclease